MIEELRLLEGLEQYSRTAIAIATVIKWRFCMNPLKQFAALAIPYPRDREDPPTACVSKTTARAR